MYPLKPVKVYLLEGAADEPRARARMERVLGAIGYSPAEVVTYNQASLPEISHEIIKGWPPDRVLEDVPLTWTRPLVMTTLQFTQERPELPGLIERCAEGFTRTMVWDFLGYIDNYRQYHERKDDWRKDYCCWTTWDFGVQTGCPHGCHYCGAGKSGRYIALGLNLEDYMEQVVGPKVQQESWQKCFRMIGWGADIIAFEPEYDCFPHYLRKLAEHDRYGYFHSNSDNVDWVEGLEHRDRLIGIWSMSSEAGGRLIEPGAPSAAARIEAMGKCCDWGVPVRPKFKPTIPVKGWREDYASVIKRIFERLQPESMGFCVIMWNTIESLQAKLDLDLLDPALVQAAWDAKDEMAGVITGPFPHDARAQIYRHLAGEARRWDQEVPLFLSTESREIWAEMAPVLGQDPKYFFCGCSSVALPGRRLALSQECPHSTYAPHGFDPSEVQEDA